ncbi:hypothetical protein EMIHUDRAFT_240187 [Emiliania huxleyi CCMP1516]|uniref:U6 snRNA-associated Sm-like protein LSm8 n=2 Tax=Emiliania huxleyi TaxID=2903 RepID=A0A0D3IHE8_EMIH1|nr:hypothetical protein EMIHUDRAFT_215471 [Emiliania huxleyi CCMP1516]XP_005774946.1 hypothetical protein EMIHUDRAFT_240187 [Emiliania huxleyi CCMP1516]EOD10683.1 hypothetical protein EMIHUDRAFT_215471 [Emiliania huxleyi CCMP1516]EOD22517.1 hypothetical protein EMIHUDRAFT_240187 [Emiliania huxleyi CCMP1516]|eukprot:XP_005763112.1 hypothetical protein EMIHUDRAFT_215471 [Emiliania huxleyi CCMP1516]
MSAMLEPLVDKVVQVITNDGRNIVGLLKGFDQTTNVILDECHERVFSTTAGVEQAAAGPVMLGLYIVRGDNIALVGEVDEEIDAEIDLAMLKAEPLKAVVH